MLARWDENVADVSKKIKWGNNKLSVEQVLFFKLKIAAESPKLAELTGSPPEYSTHYPGIFGVPVSA